MRFCLLLVFVCGCGGVSQRSEPNDVSGKLTLPDNLSPKDLIVSFQPQQNTHPGGTKVAADGSFTVKLSPGNYSFYFDAEANASVPAFKKIPAAYKGVSEKANTVSVGSDPINIEVKK